ncbi:MAG TPA: URC4/urg3 family protein [Xanthobacteraceae bacterium]|jgi:hypothetical protein|nr:URC4/urg3 family protein [Xanthobacteraceae bacterium]
MSVTSNSERMAALSLLNSAAVRERAGEVLTGGIDGRLEHFEIDLDKLDAIAESVSQLIRTNYPDLAVPFHARWRHFTLAGVDLWAARAGATQWTNDAARARTAFDLAIVSVLLDAGAGPSWRYRDQATGAVVSRSEGLGIASLRMFEKGLFSVDPSDPLRVDASCLIVLQTNDVAAAMQVGDSNPLVGLEGRVSMLNRLGETVSNNPAVFARNDSARPGGLYDYLITTSEHGKISAPAILEALLLHLGPIWPGRLSLGGVALGDTWRLPLLKRAGPTDGLMPLHKLSQWLSYSLIEPLQWSGLEVIDIDRLTGLAEYRNGGLFVDAGVIRLRNPSAASQPNPVDSALVVEWRALTVALLDRIAGLIRAKLGVSADQFPLARVLEGGTWLMGRKLARERRADGGPPIRVVSDGTVF